MTGALTSLYSSGFLFYNGHTTYFSIDNPGKEIPIIFHPAKTNNYGLMVGMITNGTASQNGPYLYNDGVYVKLDSVVDLASSNFVSLVPSAISDGGYITGTGKTRDGLSHAFLLSPIPHAP
jgi:hypothetical protein